MNSAVDIRRVFAAAGHGHVDLEKQGGDRADVDVWPMRVEMTVSVNQHKVPVTLSISLYENEILTLAQELKRHGEEIARLQDELDVLRARMTEISLLASRRIR